MCGGEPRLLNTSKMSTLVRFEWPIHLIILCAPAIVDCLRLVFRVRLWQRHLEHALAVGADGTWLDNMGPNLYGAKTGTGLLLGSYDLRYPVGETNPEPCPRELADADLEEPEEGLTAAAQKQKETAIYLFKLCRFSAMIKAQG